MQSRNLSYEDISIITDKVAIELMRRLGLSNNLPPVIKESETSESNTSCKSIKIVGVKEFSKETNTPECEVRRLCKIGVITSNRAGHSAKGRIIMDLETAKEELYDFLSGKTKVPGPPKGNLRRID
ncbi:hypothetical protein SAMN02745751_03164 [Dethiosulfatibacter aminovorans DSM 17477]|uniref:Uncharacterized protein n=1 Tax=Dethiosulfatibacter aminovorans DSM 17477 TaxID=1121476 RepID=A0A1M6LGL6_9FIRM|nr:hypothetical protein [Dethiosulfatibacter aminovorans]SHJ70248.1 hypothetical protein SAMN02745751_03164 [Dethiosulfatibacter aminovorans DSM 17477]